MHAYVLCTTESDCRSLNGHRKDGNDAINGDAWISTSHGPGQRLFHVGRDHVGREIERRRARADVPWFTPSEPAAMSPVTLCAVVEYVIPSKLVVPTAAVTRSLRPVLYPSGTIVWPCSTSSSFETLQRTETVSTAAGGPGAQSRACRRLTQGTQHRCLSWGRSGSRGGSGCRR